MAYDSDRDSLLPATSTPLEYALESIGHVRLHEEIVIADSLGVLYDVDNCPASVLPWLAWQWGLDVWDASWTEAQQRDALRNVLSVLARKGTVQSVKDAVRPYGAGVQIIEWWDQTPQGTPHTFHVNLSRGPAFLAEVVAAIEEVKPLRSHFTVSPGIGVFQTINVGTLIRVSELVTLSASL
jgi:phage tail P2-like protein